MLAELRRFGKFKGQGYLYGFPEPADRTEAALAQLDLLLEAPVAAVTEGNQRAAS